MPSRKDRPLALKLRPSATAKPFARSTKQGSAANAKSIIMETEDTASKEASNRFFNLAPP